MLLNTTKGVICKIAEPEEMPMDADGNRADIVMDPNATVNRMNPGRSYELYINAASRDTIKKIRLDIGIPEKTYHVEQLVEDIFYSDNIKFDRNYRYLMGFYKIVSPAMFTWCNDEFTDEEKIKHLANVITNGIELYCPPENPVDYPTVVRDLESNYRPTYGPVTYVGNSGKKVVTKFPIRIGSLYIMLLEKTGDDYAAVSSAKLQHFGIISQMTKSDKYGQPTRNQPVRAWGESEGRIVASYAGQKAIAEIIDRNNNPLTHKGIVYAILSADQPTNIQNVVNRNQIPYGGSKPLIIAKHVLECAGVRFVYHTE